ncbi:hypothetical protein [Embleya sp. NBC_00896]|uniref:hypothetical protein n=1 Tax=Embleya sp. NBC_00896 TaxID=2975961 RepID=UPI00386727AF|nr:hypothetical protein OG928_22705 [Embleya sp. NBC_00896]
MGSSEYRPTESGYRPELFLSSSGVWLPTPGSGGVAAAVELRPEGESATSNPLVDPSGSPASARIADPGTWTVYIRGTRSSPELYFLMGDPDAGVVYPFRRVAR